MAQKQHIAILLAFPRAIPAAFALTFEASGELEFENGGLEGAIVAEFGGLLFLYKKKVPRGFGGCLQALSMVFNNMVLLKGIVSWNVSLV